MIVGCYTLDLYCENQDDPRHKWNAFPVQITGETFNGCAWKARKAGWMINRKTGICLCPLCSGKKRLPHDPRHA